METIHGEDDRDFVADIEPEAPIMESTDNDAVMWREQPCPDGDGCEKVVGGSAD